MSPHELSRSFFRAALLLFLLGLFFVPSIVLSLALFVAAGILRLSGSPRRAKNNLFWGSVLCGIIAVIGLFALLRMWGKVEYGFTGYLVLFTPMVAAVCCITLALTYLAIHPQQMIEDAQAR